MWHLHITSSAGNTTSIGTFKTMTDVRQQILELEQYPPSGIQLEMHVDASVDTYDKAFTYFRYKGRRGLYTVKGHGN
jgi:hypothetical protein